MAIVAGASLNQTPLDWDGNRKRILQAVKEAEQQGVQILCLPELCLTGYGCEDMFFADWVLARAESELRQLLASPYKTAYTIGMPLMIEGQRFNTAVLIHNGQIRTVACKHHLANDGVYYEPRWFASWPLGKQVSISLAGQQVLAGHTTTELYGQKIAFEICEDAWRGADRLAYHYAPKGANLILNPSASHATFAKERSRHKLVQEGSQIINGTYVYANLVGNESGRLIFDGDVLVYDKGQLLAEAPAFSFSSINVIRVGEEATLSAEYATKHEEFTTGVTLALFDYMRKSRSKGFVLSLSGGADSACCAVLVAEMAKRLQAYYSVNGKECTEKLAYWPEVLTALQNGKEIISHLLFCLYQGTENSSEVTRNAAQKVAEELGCSSTSVELDDILKAYTSLAESVVGRSLTWESDDLTLQNIQARSRAPMIWMLANFRGALLLTTSNRSEGSVGYATMDGDMAGGLAPLAGIDKAYIRTWLRYAETDLGYKSLSYINEQAPTAELRPLIERQTDEADLMPYELLNQIERLLIHEKKSEQEALEILKSQFTDYGQAYLEKQITRFATMWRRNQWKRERVAPSFHLDAYSIDPKSWCRYPILSGE